MSKKNMFRFIASDNVITLDADIAEARPTLDRYLRKGGNGLGCGADATGPSMYDYYYNKASTLKKKIALLKDLGWRQVKKLK